MPSRVATRRKRRAGSIYAPLVIGGAILLSAALLARSGARAAAPVAAPTQIVAEFDTVSVPVPARFVPTGTKLADVEFKQIAYPSHQIPKDAVTSLGEVANGVSIAPLPANLPMFRANISSQIEGSNPIVERIPKGMRAMTISVDATTSVEGWAGSGSIVDVLLVEKDQATVVAEKVKILSAERSITPIDSASAPNVPKTVTLLVSQVQCLAINAAVPLGKIAFALRGASDEESWDGVRYSSEELRKGAQREPIENAITGYASVGDADRSKAFALSEGKWIRTDVKPEGFFVGQD